MDTGRIQVTSSVSTFLCGFVVTDRMNQSSTSDLIVQLVAKISRGASTCKFTFAPTRTVARMYASCVPTLSPRYVCPMIKLLLDFDLPRLHPPPALHGRGGSQLDLGGISSKTSTLRDWWKLFGNRVYKAFTQNSANASPLAQIHVRAKITFWINSSVLRPRCLYNTLQHRFSSGILNSNAIYIRSKSIRQKAAFC